MTGVNAWIRWTPEEEKRLLNLIAASKSLMLISGTLKRSMKSVKSHAKTLAQKRPPRAEGKGQMTDALSDGISALRRSRLLCYACAKQEVALARKVPLEVPQAKADPKQVDAIDATNEVPFLITASELRDRKNKRRRKQDAPRP
jgi:hypothetical protein